MEKLKHLLQTKFTIIMIVAILILEMIFAYQLMTVTAKLSDAVGISSEYYNSLGDMDRMADVATEIKALYESQGITEDIDYEQCIDTALTYFVAATGDKYARYASPEEYTERLNELKEESVGIGVLIYYEDNKGFYVTRVFEGSPADEAGILVGDYIVSADGVAVTDDNASTFAKDVAGKPGEPVEIGVNRNGENITFSIVRNNYNTYSVSYDMIGSTAYIKIDSFTYNTDEEFIETMDKLSSQGITDYIIDLRNNTGGVAETVINMVDYMVPEGLIYESIGKSGIGNSKFYSDEKEFNGNVVILTNGLTASASELFTQCLRDYDKAVVIGENSYGKGTIVNEAQLKNGGSLLFSIGKYYTQSGTCVEGDGIAPDIEVSLDDGEDAIYYKLPYNEDNQIQSALDYLQNKI